MSNDWQRFQWNLGAFPDRERPALPPFVFRQGEPDESETILRVVSSALMMERAWSGMSGLFGVSLEKRCQAALESLSPGAVVVQHGTRIIGASVLLAEAEVNLLTGPCILHEYRSRGLGNALLFDSLELLKKEGVKVASGFARVNSTAARFVYPKFGGKVASITTPKLAA